jgi:hypothetical protein
MHQLAETDSNETRPYMCKVRLDILASVIGYTSGEEENR